MPGARWIATLRLLLLPLLLAGCIPGGLTDFSSVSVGTFNAGALRHGRRLPARGEGYVVPPLWAARDASWGTEELVGMIERAARRVAREYPGALLGLGDLSLRGGRDSELHRSHRAGRDADLIFYAVDENGRPVAPANSMPRYGTDDRRARPPGPQEHGVVFGPFSPRWLDVPRNWALVRALLEDPVVEVQYLFCNERIRQQLVAHARAIGEPEELVGRAEALLRQPSDSAVHDDHLHLRIHCSPDDRALGCLDRGPLRWWKKRYKYMPPLFDPTQREELIATVRDMRHGVLATLGLAF
jgi:penicillin-insensitive murein DD-endopeptidase